MPPIVIAGAIAGGAALFGAHEQASASKKAAQTQANAEGQALDFSKQVYGDQKQLMSPYVAMGTNALQGYNQAMAVPFSQRLANLGQPYSAATAAGGALARPAAPPASGGYALGPSAGAPSSGPMVTVQAPTGETKQVPQAMAQAYVSRGARIVPDGMAQPMEGAMRAQPAMGA